MAAFERVLSGIPEMDKALDNIRLGDNVVFRVSDLSEFRMFVDPYVEQAKKDGRNIIYFRFASHEPLVEDCPEVKIYQVPLTHRFETFTVDIHNIIEKERKDAFYVFDCLSWKIKSLTTSGILSIVDAIKQTDAHCYRVVGLTSFLYR